MTARRWWAWPLVPLYAAGLGVKDGLRRAGMLRARRLTWPVVSVGSLSAGGAGKTPVVIALAELLSARGWGVDVLSRGYGRSGEGVERVDAEVEDAAVRFGDEPVLIARKTGVGVWVGGDRYAAGVAAEGWVARELIGKREENKYGDSEPSAQNDDRRGDDKEGRVHLLDDGFQHRGLGRAVDVVVVTEADLEDALLPAGNRREGLKALGRADVVVVREEERERVEGQVRKWMRGDAVVWGVRRGLRFQVKGAETKGESQRTQRKGESTEGVLEGLRVAAFCGIARPEGFRTMLAGAGCEVVEMVAFGDHHRYGAGDVEKVVDVAGRCGADGFVTTEKDAVKLTVGMLERLRAVGPVVVARLDAVFVDEAAVVRDLERRIG